MIESLESCQTHSRCSRNPHRMSEHTPLPHTACSPLPSKPRYSFLRQVVLPTVSSLVVSTPWVTASGLRESSRAGQASNPSVSGMQPMTVTKYLLRSCFLPGTELGTVSRNYLLQLHNPTREALSSANFIAKQAGSRR